MALGSAATQVLLGQAPQAVAALADAFRLSQGERAFLVGARKGEGILAAGTERVVFQAIASPAEHRLITSDPAELAALQTPTGDRERAAG